MGLTDQFVGKLNTIQRRWVYLEPIFGRGALPKEQARFKAVDEDYRGIMGDVERDDRVVALADRKGLGPKLDHILDQAR